MPNQRLKFLTKEVNNSRKYKTGSPNDNFFVSNIIKPNGSMDVHDKSIAFISMNIHDKHNLKYINTYYPLDNNGGLHNLNLGLNQYPLCAAN